MTDGVGVRRTQFPNGLTVVSEWMPGVRSVSIGAWVRIASVHEPRRLMGVSHLLEHMVFKGTRRRTAKDIAMSLENLGGSLDAYTSREHTAYQARVLDEHLFEAVDVIGDLIFAPTLREGDLALERKVVLEEIAMVDDTPDDLVFELHNELLWGDHPYGYSILGTRESVKGLGVPELRALHSAGYQPQHIVVAASGNVEHDALLAALQKAGWEDVPRGDAAARGRAGAGSGGAGNAPRGARRRADADRLRHADDSVRRPATLRDDARLDAPRRRDELPPLPARS